MTEVSVRDHARVHGNGKHGIRRTYIVPVDLVVVKLLATCATKTIQVFGDLGLLCYVSALLSGVVSAWIEYFDQPSRWLIQPALLAVLLNVLAPMSLLMGMLTELEVRTYNQAQGRKSGALTSPPRTPK